MNIRKDLVLPALLCLAATPLTSFADGTILKLEGKVLIERDGAENPASAATALRSGDMLKVGQLGKATVQFEDDSIFTIAGPTTFKVDEFAMPTRTAAGKALYTLQEGGLRTITGRISKGQGDQYALRTEEATVTVAGSAYSTLRCTNQCGGAYKKGLYVRGEKGVIIVTNAKGQLKLKAGQSAFVPAGGGPPEASKITPFADPKFAAAFAVDIGVDGEAHVPPRIEPEKPASPS